MTNLSLSYNTPLEIPKKTKILLIPDIPLTQVAQGEIVGCILKVDGLDEFTIMINNYDVPLSDPSKGMSFTIWYARSVRHFFRLSEMDEVCTEEQRFLRNVVILAISGAKGEITGIAAGDPVPFSFP